MILYLLDLLFLLSLLHRMFRLWGDLFPSAGRLSSTCLCSISSYYIDIFSLGLQFDSSLRVNSSWRGVAAFACKTGKLYFCPYCLLVQQSSISAKRLIVHGLCLSYIYIQIVIKYCGSVFSGIASPTQRAILVSEHTTLTISYYKTTSHLINIILIS